VARGGGASLHLIAVPVPLTPSPQPLVPRVAPDERAARRSLLGQVARLEAERSQLFSSSWPRKGLERQPCGGGGPRLLSIGELEELRDELAADVQDARRALSARTDVEELGRRLIEEMMRAPEQHRWARVSHEDIGEPGCGDWHVRPRWGLLGMLRGWWRVVVSSGCP